MAMKGITPHNTQTVVVKMKVMTNEAHTYNMNFKEKLHIGLKCRDRSLLIKNEIRAEMEVIPAYSSLKFCVI